MPDKVAPISDTEVASIEPTSKVHVSALNSVPAVSAIGLVAARMLQQHQIVTLIVGTDGYIEVVPPGELELDNWGEEDALQNLIQRGYTDQQLADYLRQRAIRKPGAIYMGRK